MQKPGLYLKPTEIQYLISVVNQCTPYIDPELDRQYKYIRSFDHEYAGKTHIFEINFYRENYITISDELLQRHMIPDRHRFDALSKQELIEHLEDNYEYTEDL